MADSVAKSMGRGRLLGSLAMVVLGALLATKGIVLSEADMELGTQFIEIALACFASAIPAVLSKMRESERVSDVS